MALSFPRLIQFAFFLLLIGGKHPGNITFSLSAAPIEGIPGPRPIFEGLSPKGIHGTDTALATRQVNNASQSPAKDTHKRTLLFSHCCVVQTDGQTPKSHIFLIKFSQKDRLKYRKQPLACILPILYLSKLMRSYWGGFLSYLLTSDVHQFHHHVSTCGFLLRSFRLGPRVTRRARVFFIPSTIFLSSMPPSFSRLLSDSHQIHVGPSHPHFPSLLP